MEAIAEEQKPRAIYYVAALSLVGYFSRHWNMIATL